MKTNIDVVIPVKDRQKLLLNALDSVNKQILLPEKVIIVDDCSKKEIFVNKKYNFKIKILRNKVNKGVSFSRNKGVKYSKNQYVSFLDSDDIWSKDKLSFQHKLIKKNDLDFISSDLIFLKKKLENNKGNLLREFLSLNSFPNPSSIIFKRKIFLKLGGFDEKLKTCEDNDIWIKILSSKYKILSTADRKVIINKFSEGQLSRNFFLREQSVHRFLKKNKNIFKKYLNFDDLEKFNKMYSTKAYIPILKKAIIKFEFRILIRVLPMLLGKRFFYERVFNFFLKKLV